MQTLSLPLRPLQATRPAQSGHSRLPTIAPVCACPGAERNARVHLAARPAAAYLNLGKAPLQGDGKERR